MIQQALDFVSNPNVYTFLNVITDIVGFIAMCTAGVSWFLRKYKTMFGSLSFLALALLVMAVDIGSEHFIFGYLYPDVRFARDARFHAMIYLKITVMIGTLSVAIVWLSAIHPWLTNKAQDLIRTAQEKQYEKDT